MTRNPPTFSRGDELRETQASQEVSVPRQQYQRQRQEVLANQTQVDRLQQERQQHSKELAGAKDALQNAIALSSRDVLGKVTDNQKHLAQVDSQIEQAKQDNQNRIAEIDAQLNRAQQPQGEPLTAPIAGVVFDLQSSAPGYAMLGLQVRSTIHYQ